VLVDLRKVGNSAIKNYVYCKLMFVRNVFSGTNCSPFTVKECQFLALAMWLKVVIAHDVYAIDFQMVSKFSAIWRDADGIVFQTLKSPLPGVMRKQVPWPVH